MLLKLGSGLVAMAAAMVLTFMAFWLYGLHPMLLIAYISLMTGLIIIAIDGYRKSKSISEESAGVPSGDDQKGDNRSGT